MKPAYVFLYYNILAMRHNIVRFNMKRFQVLLAVIIMLSAGLCVGHAKGGATTTSAPAEPIGAAPGTTMADDKGAPVSGALDAEIVEIPALIDSITLRFADPLGEKKLRIANDEERNRLKAARAKDNVTVVVDDILNPTTAASFKKISRSVPESDRWLSLGAGAALIFLASCLATGIKPSRLIIGMDNRYSNSQFQLALWFAVVATAYFATFALRYRWDLISGISIPTQLLAMSGLSGLSFVGAKAITAGKEAAAQETANKKANEAEKAHAAVAAIRAAFETSETLPATAEAATLLATAEAEAKTADKEAAKAAQNTKSPAEQPNFWTDLVLNDKNQADLGDFQMVIITLVAVGVYALQIF
ncbi:MAG: hypothetical protein N2444_08260, partial [Methylocystis sp.]|nr:hypothetical protein [Methylocystis sp.]